MIELSNITKKYNDRLVLKNINIKFRKKELVCILGPSGSGKTTLLNLIGALDSPTSGDIYFGNYNINNINEEYYHNRIVSFIFQNYNLINNLNLYDNLILPLKLTNKKINILKIKYYLNKFGLNKDLKNNIKDLSGGEKQRVAIIRSLLSNSKIILADEPTGALDTLNGEKVMQLLQNISKDKLVIIVTHNEKLAKKYATRIIRIKDGVVESDSNPYDKVIKYDELPVKTKLKLIDKIKISLININSKRLRNILTSLAFSIGLFSLTLVLSISNGFNKELNNLKQNSLFTYPLIISKENYQEKTNIIDNNNYSKDIININNNYQIIKNSIDSKLLSKIEDIEKQKLAYSAIYYKVPESFSQIAYVNPSTSYFNLVKGKFPQNKNEILLLIDENNSIDELVKSYLQTKDLSYDNIVNIKISINNVELIISGIVKSNNEYFSSLNGFLYEGNLFNTEIRDIYLYPTSYENKEKIKGILKEYSITDNASEVLSLTNSLIEGISLILILFSIISLIVSSIMICVICYISIMERKNEIGILESIGTNKKDLKSLFITENQIIGLFSSLMGVILTIITSHILNNYINKTIGFNNLISLNFNIIIIIVDISLVLINIATFFPLRIIKKRSIIDNIRDY